MTRVLLALVMTSVIGAAADKPRPLANGVYALLGEGVTAKGVSAEKVPYIVMAYEEKYVALDASNFVPLVLSGPPLARKDDRGWTMLNVSLAQEHVKPLEDFTRDHLGGKVAILIDGEIITIHKVRTVIQDGKAQITRCDDDGCSKLLLKLTK